MNSAKDEKPSRAHFTHAYRWTLVHPKIPVEASSENVYLSGRKKLRETFYVYVLNKNSNQIYLKKQVLIMS